MLQDKLLGIYSRSITWPKWLNTIKVGGTLRYFITIFCNYLLKYNYKYRSSLPTLVDEANKSEIIISLTTFPKRIGTVWLTIESLLQQSVKPKSIILWLSKEQFSTIESLPKELLDQQKRGLVIEFVDGDLKSHKKYYYVFNKFPNNPIILVDDDLIYHSKMVERLLKGFDKQKIHFSYGYKMKRTSTGNIDSYNKWLHIKGESSDQDLFFGSGGGTLLVPKSLFKDCLNVDLFMNLCPKADDVWLNAMARISGIKIEKVKECDIVPVIIKDNESLASTNVYQSLNDIQIDNVNKYYQKIMKIIVF